MLYVASSQTFMTAVIDKMLFNQWTVTDCESLTDYTQPATVSVRHGDAKIPKRTRKIIVTNTADAWPTDPHGQIVGRVWLSSMS